MIEVDCIISLNTGEPLDADDEDEHGVQFWSRSPNVSISDDWGSVDLTPAQMDRLVSLWQQWKSQEGK